MIDDITFTEISKLIIATIALYMMMTSSRIFDHRIECLERDLKDYKDATARDLPFRSLFRSSLEDSARVCELFEPSFSPAQKKKLAALLKTKETATQGRTLHTLTSSETKDYTATPFAVSEKVVVLTISSWDRDKVTDALAATARELKQRDFNAKIASGEIVPFITKKELEDLYNNDKPQFIQTIQEHYDDLDLLFQMFAKWPDTYYHEHILLAWEYSSSDQTKLVQFKRYLDEYCSHMDNFSKVVSHAKINPLYRDYLIFEYAANHGLGYIFGDLRGLTFDLPLLEIYTSVHEKWVTEKYNTPRTNFYGKVIPPDHDLPTTLTTARREFAEMMLYYVTYKNTDTLDGLRSLRTMYDYLFEMIGVAKNQRAIVTWINTRKPSNCSDVIRGCFYAGYVHWDRLQLHNSIKAWTIDPTQRDHFLDAYFETRNGECLTTSAKQFQRRCYDHFVKVEFWEGVNYLIRRQGYTKIPKPHRREVAALLSEYLEECKAKEDQEDE